MSKLVPARAWWLLAGLALGWLFQGWRMGEWLANQRTEYEQQLRVTAETNAAVILQQQALDKRLTALDE